MLLFAAFHRRSPLTGAANNRSSTGLLRLAGLLILCHTVVFANTVFSSQFSDPNNVGNIGGGILSGSASDANINQGPWQGTYHGSAGLLAAPKLQVASGSATISGIVGVNLLGLGLTNNYGWFFQATGLNYQPNTLYTLTADISSGGALNASILSNDGVGIGLTAGGDAIVGASTDLGALLSLQLLSGNRYQMSYQFLTGGTAPSGNIGIRLFDQPEGLLTANLLSSVTFSNVSLDASSQGAVPEPASLTLTGTALLALGVYARRKQRLKPIAI